MSKRIIIATLLALAVGSNAVLADEGKSEQAGATEPVTTLYKDNSAITTYEQLNP